jgi:GDP-mannose transporter
MADAMAAGANDTSSLATTMVGHAVKAEVGGAGFAGISPAAVTSAAALGGVGLAVLLGSMVYQHYAVDKEKARATTKMATLIVIYSLCSSSLLIINKVCVTIVPAPSFVLFTQLLSSAVMVKIMAGSNIVDAEPFQWEKGRKYIAVVTCFAGFLYCNVKALQYVPVDTIICFRASIPLVVSIIEFFFLGRELPTLRSWISLTGVLVGAVAYTYNDIFFSPRGYVWVGLWYTLCVVDSVIMKHVADTVPMTTWSRTYYNNAMAVPLILPISFLSGESEVIFGSNWLTVPGLWALGAGCAVGLAMNFFSWKLREAVSATTVTVIGNICKFITILANILIWDQHSDAKGTAALVLCLSLGALYQQAPKRKPKGGAAVADSDKTPLLERPSGGGAKV